MNQWKYSVFLGLCGLATMGSAWAESTVDAEPMKDVQRLDQVIVVGEKASTPLHYETDPKLPRQPMPASDGADYLKSFPGFSALRNGGTNADPVFRGLFGSRLQVQSHGGVMHGACPARMDNSLSYVSPATYDRLEIVKGPQTVLGGPGASAGTVRFERNTQRFDEAGIRAQASAQLARFGRNDQELDVAAGQSQGFVRFVGNRGSSDDYQDGDGSRIHSGWSRWSADVTFGWTPSDDTVVEITTGRGDGNARYATRGMDGVMFERTSHAARWLQKSWGTFDELEVSWYQNTSDHLMDNHSFRAPNPNSPHMMMRMPMASNVWQRVEGGRIEASVNQDWGSLDVGASWQKGEHRFRRAGGVGAYASKPWRTDATDENLALFAEYNHGFDNANRLVAGARMDWAEVTDHRRMLGSMMNPKPNPTRGQTRTQRLPSGFVRWEHQQPNTHWLWYAGMGYVARMPDYWELFSPKMGPMGSANAFAAIQPEHTQQLDVGARYQHGQWDVDVSAYLGRIDDYILFRYMPVIMNGMNTGRLMTRAQNIDARIRGVEASVAYDVNDALTLHGSLAHAWGEQAKQDKPLPQMPPTELRFAAEYDVGHWQMGGLLRVVGGQDRAAIGEGNVISRDISTSKAFATLAVHGSYQFNDHWRGYVGVDNVLDRTYSEHLNLSGSADFGFPADTVRINEPGRVWWARVTFAY